MGKLNLKKMPKENKAPASTRNNHRAPVRLWQKAAFLSFRRARDVVHHQQALIKIEGVNDKKQLTTYNGKRCAYVYKAQKNVKGTKYRAMWGKICRAHGNNGLAIAKFRKNLPPRALGAHLRVFLYPQRTQTVQKGQY